MVLLILFFYSLDKISNVKRHFFDLGVVELLNVAEHPDVLGGDKVDGDSLPTEAATPSDSR
jgi:hypothetical protein